MSDFTPAQGINWLPGGQVGRVIYDEGDKALSARFFRVSVPNGTAAIANGGPAYVAEDHVQIFRPAEHNLWAPVHRVEEIDKARFPRQWEAYQNSRAQVPDGFPIALMFPSDPDRVDILRSMRIHTIEQLAGVSEGALGKLGMGGRELVERAKEYLDKAGDREQWSAMERQREQDQAVIAALKAEMAELASRFSQREGAPA